MANRDDLLIIRAARAGEAAAQLTLGKRYLFGGTGLPKSLATALYWLDRAAQQDEADAWLLIGRHVPFETVRQSADPAKLTVWYERAFEAGVAQAGLVLAKLVLEQADGAVSEAMRNKALRALHVAAHAGIADAQWLLAQSIGHGKSDTASNWPADNALSAASDSEAMREWATRAARSGVIDAQYALAGHAWASNDRAGFLRWALPLARQLIHVRGTSGAQASWRDISLVSRCAHVLLSGADDDPAEVGRFLEFAAQAGDRNAQFSLGLWLAHMDEDGNRVTAIPGLANYKRAIHWLLLAAEQGMPAAWFALSRIYQKPGCSKRDQAEARHCLDIAAQAGHGGAQYELGLAAWRGRREQESNDVLAAFWLHKAAAQGIAEAGALLETVVPRAIPAAWAQELLQRLSRDTINAQPLLVARLELAAAFGLSQTEALLIDPKNADRGHCLVVDVKALHPHSKRRLIRVETASERRLLERIVGLFNQVDCGPNGPEGNYRQRLYRLRTLA